MNYQHAFHAGNFADCFKHVLLVALLDALTRKPSPLFVLDTHAGAGHYDLQAEAARRTGEADFGIRRLLACRPVGLERYLGLVDQLEPYPGSSALIRAVLRDQDRLVCCELDPEAVRRLRGYFRHDSRVHVHQRSGWEAIGGLLPPVERRGLVFIDPPFEETDEFTTLAEAIGRAHRRFGHGVLAGWYPMKRQAVVRGFYADVVGLNIRDVIAVEFRLRKTLDPGRFNGCGMIVVNPPYLFLQSAHSLAEAVLQALGPLETGAGVDLIRLADE